MGITASYDQIFESLLHYIDKITPPLDKYDGAVVRARELTISFVKNLAKA